MRYHHSVLSHNVIVVGDLVDLAPCTHDEWIVGSNDSDVVNTLLLQSLDVLDVWWKVVGLAAGSKSTWHRDEDDLLALPLLVGVVLLGTTARSGISVGDWGPSVLVSQCADGEEALGRYGSSRSFDTRW